MKISYKNYLQYLDRNNTEILNSIKSFYYTFGYIVLSDAITESDVELLKTRVLLMSKALLPQNSRNQAIINKTVIMHKALEGDPQLIKWFAHNNMYLSIIKHLLGDNAAFFNSDANIFIHGASWHRDVGTCLPTVKFLTYLQDSNHRSGAGDFAVIPGSHWVTDAYSSYLNANGSWPSGPPFSHNYYGYVDNSQLRKSRRVYDGSQFPFHTIHIRKGDVVLFDNRLYHTTYLHPKSIFSFFNRKNFKRLNFSALFIANPVDLNPNCWLLDKVPFDKVRNELDDFYKIISNFEDCRYHKNLRDTKMYPELEPHLYFSKYGYTDQAENVFDSSGAQFNAQEKLRRWFISKDALDILK